jgi:hypothetical protein
MDWVSGVQRNDDGDLCVRVQVDSRGANLAPGTWPGLGAGVVSATSITSTSTTTTVLKGLESLSAELDRSGAPGTVRRKVHLPLHELRVGATTTREYLDGLGLPNLGADGQPVYEVSTSAGLLAIPAQVLVQAVLGVHSQFRRALLRPWGPGFLMTAFAESGAQSLALRPTPHRMLQIQLEQPTIATKLEWILAYPSATAAWCSVYRHALDGRFDMDMPKAFATASISARPVDGKLFVTRLEVMVMTPAEEPHPYAAATANRSFIFNESVRRRPTHGKAAAPSRDERFACGQQRQAGQSEAADSGTKGGGELQAQEPSEPLATVVPLTDAQWARIEPLVLGALNPKGPAQPGAPRAHAMRDVVDVIRLKLGAPYSWLKVPVDRKLAKTASAMLSKLSRCGAWEAVAVSSQAHQLG